MPLIIIALLLISAALGQDHRVVDEGQIFPLDMAPNSVDDQYDGCRNKMASLVKTTLLKKELNKLDAFKKAWEKGEKHIPSNWKFWEKLKKKHKVAIWVYSDPESNIYQFNIDTHKDKQNYANMIYKWHSLHFLLTDAIQILKKKQNRSFNMPTFRGTNVKFNGHVFTGMRFGSFTSSSIYRGRAKSFGNVSCFEIYTREGASIAKYSRTPYEGEVLIPPYETFIVTAVNKRADQPGLWCETVFVLNSTGIRSDLNCALFKKPTIWAALNKVL